MLATPVSFCHTRRKPAQSPIIMPIHLHSTSRRQFLVTSLAGGVTVLTQRLFGEDAPTSWALLSDSHIAADAALNARDVNMADNLRRVSQEVLAEKANLHGVFLNGDCAYTDGRAGDYQTLSGLLKPVSDAGLPISFNMGNHDDRVHFYGGFADQQTGSKLVEGKHITVVETPLVNWFLVDSLFKVNVVTGEIGQAQLAWLAQALDARADKPAIVMGHHNLQETPTVKDGKESYTGMQDSIAFRDLLVSKRQVKAFVYGHTHNWAMTQPAHLGGLHLVNLPPVAYVFNPARPNGWVRATPTADGITLELRALDVKHAEHGQPVKLAWRAA